MRVCLLFNRSSLAVHNVVRVFGVEVRLLIRFYRRFLIAPIICVLLNDLRARCETQSLELFTVTSSLVSPHRLKSVLDWPFAVVATDLKTTELNGELLDKILKHIAIVTHKFASNLLLESFCNVNVGFFKVLE